MIRPGWRVAIGAALLLVGLAGCTGKADPSPPPAVEEPQRGGTLRLGIVRPASLDPARATSIHELLIADQLFDSLTSYAATTAEPRPSLAASWTASADLTMWEFRLRPGATFVNGRAITATDVKYSLDRVAAPATRSSVADLLEAITGFGAVASGAAVELSGVSVEAPDVVRIGLDRPLTTLPSLLGSPALAVVPREAVEASSVPFAERPVGSGPFRLLSRDPQRLLLGAADPSRAYVDDVEVALFDSDGASYDAFTRGSLDWSSVPPDRTTSVDGREVVRPYAGELFYGFNLRNPKYADVRFREAIVRAVSRDAIARRIYSGALRARTGFVVEGVPGYVADPCGERCRNDQARSRALLAEAFPDGRFPEVVLDHEDERTQIAVAAAIQTDLQAVGLSVTTRATSAAAYSALLASGQQEVFRLGWIAPYPTADAFLGPLFESTSASNLTGLRSPAVDASLAAGRAAADPAARVEHFRAAERAVLDAVPVVPIGHFETRAALGSRVRGLDVTVMGTFDATAVWLVAAR